MSESKDKILFASLNAVLKACGCRRKAEDLVMLIGVIGVSVLAIEVQKEKT